MAKTPFDIFKFGNEKSRADLAAQKRAEIVELDIESIIENEKNSLYNMTGIDELKSAIEIAGGVKQNLIVMQIDENKYKILAGHRRYIACKELVNEGKTQYKKVPCLIENIKNENMQELLLIYTNASVREMTAAEKVAQAERAIALLTEIKKDMNISGRIRDLAEKMLNESPAQIKRYQKIIKNLQNEDLKEAFNEGKINIGTAYTASSLDEKQQQTAAVTLQEKGSLTKSDVDEIKNSAPKIEEEQVEEGGAIQAVDEKWLENHGQTKLADESVKKVESENYKINESKKHEIKLCVISAVKKILARMIEHKQDKNDALSGTDKLERQEEIECLEELSDLLDKKIKMLEFLLKEGE